MKFLHNPLPTDGDHSFAFPVQCFLLKLVGAWPILETAAATADPYAPKTSSTSLSKLAGFAYLCWSHGFIVLIGLTCLAQSAFVFGAWGDILTVTECGCTVLMGIHNLLRLIHLSWHRSQLRQLNTEFARNIWISRFCWWCYIHRIISHFITFP